MLTVLALTASGLAFSRRAAAIRQRDQAIISQVIAEALQYGTSDTPLAAQLTLAAYRIQPTPDLASRLVNIENTPLSAPLTAGAAPVDSVAFSPGGRTLASGSADGTIRLWNVTDPTHPRLLGPPKTGGAGAVVSVAFSSDGRTLASGDNDGTIVLWNVTDPAHPHPLGQPLTGSSTALGDSVAFSSDGRTLASGDYDGTIQLWNVTDPAHPGPPLTGGTTAAVTSVAFSPGGRTLASDADGAIRLWNVTDPAHPGPLGPPLTGSSTAAVHSVAFSPDGRTLASGDYNGTIRLWNLNVQYAIQRICATPGGLTPRQWNQYIPQLQYKQSCAR